MTEAAAEIERSRVPPLLLGMLLFISSEVMFFGALFGAHFTLRGRGEPWPLEGTPALHITIPLVSTFFLLASSVTVHRALAAARKDDRSGTSKWLGVTIALGGIFLAGQAYDYASLLGDGFTIGTNVQGALFYTLTGFHGLHVLGGLVGLGIVLSKARAGHMTARRHGALEAVSWYWHFVDVVWIFVFSTIYLLR